MINEGNVDIQKFLASKVHQLAKKMESSKAMAKPYPTSCRRHTSSPGTINVSPTYSTSHWELSQKKITCNHKPETAKLQDTGSSHYVENTQHAATR